MNNNFETEMRIIELKGLIRETEKTLSSTRYLLAEPEMNCLDLANVIKSLEKVEQMISFVKSKTMQIMDKK